MSLFLDTVPNIATASHLIRANDLCRLMYHATLNHIFVTLNPDCGLMGESTPDVDQVGRLWKAKAFVFGPSGERFISLIHPLQYYND
jgi:hypothetical protein